MAGGSGQQVSARLHVKVTPAARSDGFAGWMGDTLKVRVRAAPEKGKANDAVVGLIARWLNVERAAVSVRRGRTSQSKVIAIDGLSADEVRYRLGTETISTNGSSSD